MSRTIVRGLVGGLLLAVAAAWWAGCGGSKEAAGTPVPSRIARLRFQNQAGETVQLADLKGKPVLLSFIYTRCPVPMMCPLTMQSVARIQAELSPEDRQRIALVTITFDPEYDTPEVLRQYGAGYNADFDVWQFWTADRKTTDEFIDAFGVWAKKMGDIYNHNMKGIVLNPDGSVSGELSGSNWSAREVADYLRGLVPSS